MNWAPARTRNSSLTRKILFRGRTTLVTEPIVSEAGSPSSDVRNAREFVLSGVLVGGDVARRVGDRQQAVRIVILK